ncbi:hypothetical protein NBM05_03700 [Rothia sp. AR01]|uniref:Uncharacterized protein n=1 Tax=Rothia santali TaxID=2949643 RepID=A0A9X2KHG6_9MICC|nr:hypothetical protein [Rothia santali]MCP3425153.1 hypothetical protein [Rothia santali]
MTETYPTVLDHDQSGCPASADDHHLIDWSPAPYATKTHSAGTCLYCRLAFITRKVST